MTIRNPIRKCLVPHCHNAATSRGFCVNCYHQANKKVKAGLTTWEELKEKAKSK